MQSDFMHDRSLKSISRCLGPPFLRVLKPHVTPHEFAFKPSPLLAKAQFNLELQ